MEVHNPKDIKSIEVFPGIKGKILHCSKKIMLLWVVIPKHSVVPRHRHSNEQMGVCIKGKSDFVGDACIKEISEGMTYSIKSNEWHEVRNTSSEDAVFLDIFSPPRKDYLEKLNKN